MQFIDLAAQRERIKDKLDVRIKAVLEHGKFIMGPEVKELEGELQKYTGTKFCVGCGNGTDALQIAMMALGVGPGDEVITTPFSFFATVETIVILGAKPVFVDIDPQTYNLDPDLLEAAISDKTKAIIPVSLYGQCADFDRINEIAGKHKVAVIEDGAQSFGASYKGKKSCSMTTLATTSFFPSKPLGGFGDGGAVFTNDEKLAEKLRMIRVHGSAKRYDHVVIGVNSRLDTLQAAVLLEKLKILDEEVAGRDKVAKKYASLFGGSAKTPVVQEHNVSAWAQYTIEVEGREGVIEALKEKGIPTAVHYPKALHLQTALLGQGYEAGQFPHAEAAAERVVSLPMHPYMTDEEIEAVATTILDEIRKAA